MYTEDRASKECLHTYYTHTTYDSSKLKATAALNSKDCWTLPIAVCAVEWQTLHRRQPLEVWVSTQVLKGQVAPVQVWYCA